MDNNFRQSIVEALVLASPEPLPARKIAEMIEGMSPSGVSQAVAGLNTRYMESGSSFRIREIAGGYQVYIVPEFTGYVQEMFSRRRKMRLTRAALETLAIITYRQPVTRIEIEQIRGVASDAVIHNLLEKNMITIKGRAETVGKPLQYGTTDEFLKFFGLNSLEDLPRMSEIEELIASESESDTEDLGFGETDDNGNGKRFLAVNVADSAPDAPGHVERDQTEERTVATVSPDEESESEAAAEEPSSDDRAGSSGITVDIDTT
ncbi:MAG: SMC-Scp complex subunit ScpB [Candidatus Zixiibacteriota bacterium]|nr:MAG: SMC-Scp complex subunit ScpB [candidate division Zixibacteria bacterium]